MGRRPNKAEKTRGVVGYFRVSTEEQAVSGLGLAAQEKAIRQECRRRGLPLLAIQTDAGVSAKNLNRPALDAALADLETGRDRAPRSGVVRLRRDRRRWGQFVRL